MTVNTKYQKLFEPGSIGSLHLRNRMVKMGAQPGSVPSPDGNVPEILKDYYEAVARGGVALVTAGGGIIEVIPNNATLNRFRIDDDKYIPSLRELSQVIQKHGCPAFLQLMGRGPSRKHLDFGIESKAASTLSQDELPLPYFAPTRELTVAEIEQFVDLFASTAERIHKAGFQGIELNSANNHLLNTFLSRVWNKRRDAYGIDSLESRAKIVADIIREIKKRNGQDFVVISLINGMELGLEKGITPEESCGIARVLQAAGADAIHVRVHFYNRPSHPDDRISTECPDIAMYPEVPFSLGPGVDTHRHGAGGWTPIAAMIKKAVSIPIISVGRLDADLGVNLLRQGAIDFINLNRRIMADYEYPRKIFEGRLKDIRPCTGCYTCFDSSEHHLAPLCMVNAALGHDREYEIKPADKKKRVLIVGGGPAGMEAARVAALRGHHVILYEKQSYLGGSLPLAAMVKGFEREDFLSFVRYLSNQMDKLGVDVRSGIEVNRTIIEKVKPDVLIIATGGVHNIPNIPGIQNSNVITSYTLHKLVKRYLKFLGPQALSRLTHYWMPVGKNVVILGGGIHGCQTATFLIKRGRKVTILETGDTFGKGLLETNIKKLLLTWLASKGAVMLTGVKYEEINGKNLIITTKDGKKQAIPADTILTALPLLPDTELLKTFKGLALEIYSIGDCHDPQLTVNAVADGYRIAMAI
ncbi:MAG: FAD-dependent oxidoreductase [Dehalococcoidales bacterium]|nr:FAD-dependent oxidoreductase [Dehalococcoidales bacterium]